MPPDTITVDGAQYVRAYHVADGICAVCGAGPRAWKPGQIIDALRRDGGPKMDEWSESRHDRPSVMVVRRVFGGWGKALRAAGFTRYAPGVETYWTQERILAAFETWARDNEGRGPTYKEWEKAAANRPCAKQVEQRFGSWNAALDAGGFTPRRNARWTSKTRPRTVTELIGVVDAEPIAEVIRNELAAGSTLRNLANEIGVDESYLGKIVNGKPQIRADYADRILCALDRPHVFAEAAA